MSFFGASDDLVKRLALRLKALESSQPIEFGRQLRKSAKDYYGETFNFPEAGWIGPRGRLYDLSGRHWNQDEAAKFPRQFFGQRMVDHSEIPDEASELLRGQFGEIYPELEQSGVVGSSPSRYLFQKYGQFLRNFPGQGAEFVQSPSADQLKALIRGHNEYYSGDPLYVDIFEPFKGLNASEQIERPNIAKVKRVLKALED